MCILMKERMKQTNERERKNRHKNNKENIGSCRLLTTYIVKWTLTNEIQRLLKNSDTNVCSAHL